MTKILSLDQAHSNLSMLVDEVSEHNTRVIIQKRGKDKVVIISAEEYLRSVIPVDPLFLESRKLAVLNGTSTFSDSMIEAEIKDARLQ